MLESAALMFLSKKCYDTTGELNDLLWSSNKRVGVSWFDAYYLLQEGCYFMSGYVPNESIEMAVPIPEHEEDAVCIQITGVLIRMMADTDRELHGVKMARSTRAWLARCNVTLLFSTEITKQGPMLCLEAAKINYARHERRVLKRPQGFCLF